MDATSGKATQPHLQIFNFDREIHNTKSAFTLFPLLPPEIRLKIWRHLLEHHRIITVHWGIQLEPLVEPTENHARPIINGYQSFDKLLHVNHESRRTALSFYRVHIPCKIRRGPTGEGEITPGIFYFNPEYDFLLLNSGLWAKDTLIEFLYHLKNTYDPCHVGLLNLAVTGNGLNGNDLCDLEPSDINPDVGASFTETLTHLRYTFFVQTVSAGRHVTGISSGIGSETILNRSFPILTTTTSFELLSSDPRPIAGDLEQVYVETDPFGMLSPWQQLLKKWNASPSRIQYRFMLAYTPPGLTHIYDRKSAENWIQKEEYEWTGGWRMDDRLTENNWGYRFWEDSNKISTGPIGALHEKYVNEDLEKAVRPALGFWLFPIHAFGGFPAEESVQNRSFGKEFLNLTQYWPELGLLSLP